jgi:hypothetical protein
MSYLCPEETRNVPASNMETALYVVSSTGIQNEAGWVYKTFTVTDEKS